MILVGKKQVLAAASLRQLLGSQSCGWQAGGRVVEGWSVAPLQGRDPPPRSSTSNTEWGRIRKPPLTPPGNRSHHHYLGIQSRIFLLSFFSSNEASNSRFVTLSLISTHIEGKL